MDKITRILKNVIRCKYFEAGIHIKNMVFTLKPPVLSVADDFGIAFRSPACHIWLVFRMSSEHQNLRISF